LMATFGTLTFVPVFFAFMHRNDRPREIQPAVQTSEAQA